MVALHSAGLRVHRHILQLTLTFHSLRQKEAGGKTRAYRSLEESQGSGFHPCSEPSWEKSPGSMRGRSSIPSSTFPSKHAKAKASLNRKFTEKGKGCFFSVPPGVGFLLAIKSALLLHCSWTSQQLCFPVKSSRQSSLLFFCLYLYLPSTHSPRAPCRFWNILHLLSRVIFMDFCGENDRGENVSTKTTY